MNHVTTILDQIGRTPLVRLQTMDPRRGADQGGRMLVKLERGNPGGSVKDRIASAMVRAAESEGLLRTGGVVIEPTSGNTGIGLAWVCAARGYRTILTMPESMSVERRKVLVALGAEIILTPGDEGMRGAMATADRLAAETPGAFMPRQFSNPVNPAAHEATTGPEIWRDARGVVDVFVAGIGTGGTITGVGRFLRRVAPSVRIVGVEPAGSPFLSEGRTGEHAIQGIGAGFKPDVLDPDLPDEILTVSDDEAKKTTRELARREGIFAGISSGAALAAALRIAARNAMRGKTIVTLLPDGGDRYLAGAWWEAR
ncbi:cysteine synthase A [Candidatus Bipolaricaulota bacterium]|nr:cysteine synthase A [Candidatus Bipolaricaulota bacterium]